MLPAAAVAMARARLVHRPLTQLLMNSTVAPAHAGMLVVLAPRLVMLLLMLLRLRLLLAGVVEAQVVAAVRCDAQVSWQAVAGETMPCASYRCHRHCQWPRQRAPDANELDGRRGEERA